MPTLQATTVVLSRRVARIWKRGGGGYFERVRKVQTTLTRIFIVIESEPHGLSQNWMGISRKWIEIHEIETFFPPKLRWSPKKKKKVFTKIETAFSAKIGNSNVFSAQNQVVSKKKKRSSPKLRLIFRPKSEIHTLFQAASRHILHNFGTHFLMGGCFQFFSNNRPQKHLKRAILHTSQANGGGARAPSPHPPLATLLVLSLSYRFTLNSRVIGQKAARALSLEYEYGRLLGCVSTALCLCFTNNINRVVDHNCQYLPTNRSP